MKRILKLSLIFAAMVSVISVTSCKKDNQEKEKTAKVSLTAGDTTETTFTFTLATENADRAAYMLVEGTELPAAEKIMKEGTDAKAGTYTVKDLKQNTVYSIAAAASSKSGKLSAVASLKFQTKSESNPDPEYKLTLEMTLGAPNHASIPVKIVPSDAEATYFPMVFPAEEVKDLSDDELVEKIMDNFRAQAEQLGVELSEVIKNSLQKGEIDGAFNNLKAETEYQAIAFGLQETGERTSLVYRKDAKTTEMQMSDITFDIQIPEDKIESASISIKITPSNLDEKFVWLCEPVSKNPGKSAREIAEAYVKTFGNMLNMGMGLVSGVQDYPDYKVIPDTEYYVVVFAYNSGITSEPVMANFTSKQGVDFETFDCTFNIREVAATTVTYDVLPTDNTIFYMSGAMPADNFDIEKMKSDIENYILEYLAFQQQMNPAYTLLEAINNVCYMGKSEYQTVQELQKNTKYKLFAFAINKEGKASEKYVVSDEFTTLESDPTPSGIVKKSDDNRPVFIPVNK